MNKRENESGGIDFVPVLEVGLNKSRSNNILVSNVLTAFGLEKNFILDLFSNAEEVVNSYSSSLNIDDREQAIRAVYSRVSTNAGVSLERKKDFILERFFGSERFFLSRFGRYKIQKKLSLSKLLQGRVLAEDLVDSKTKKIVFKKGTMIETEDQNRLEDFFKKNNNFVVLGSGQGRLQKAKVYVDNFKREASVNVLGVDPDNSSDNLLLADILVIISGIFNLSHDIGEIDDIDSLANRSVRLIDELVEEHFVSGLQRVSDETQKKLDDTFLSKLLETFYRPVVDGRVLNEKITLSAIEERNVYIAPATTKLTSDLRIANKTVTIYYHDNLIEVDAKEIQYIGYAPEQMFSVAAAMIPFLENNDANRALMGANMQKQALPLIQPQSPLVGTGLEWQVARDSGFSLVSRTSGRVVYADSCIITIEEDETKRKKNYYPYNFLPSNQRTVLSHEVLVNKGDLIKPGQVLADGTSIQDGELALGKDLLVGFMT
nr:DNA-directed RNA polymerase subunit beta-like [Lytechinus pictus]